MTECENKPNYIIFAGINGAGKTALYSVLAPHTDLGTRVSVDDIAASLGDWRDTLVQLKAARSAMNLLGELIKERVSINQETTLPGEAIVRYAKQAREAGYFITLYFVGIENVEMAIERVKARVAKGGHGIEEAVIRKRFSSLSANLARLIPYCDVVYLYDNSTRFRQVAVMRGGVMVDIDPDMPLWLRFVPGAPEYTGAL
jgi:predicted ABC-type ATPase